MWKYVLLVSATVQVCLQERRGGIPKEQRDSMQQGAGFYASQYAHRFTVPIRTTRKIVTRSTVMMISLDENCDYLAFYCLKAYDTGAVCGRTLVDRYYNFTNYCMLDYINCMERYDVWEIAYMGFCLPDPVDLHSYEHYPYDDDLFMEQYFVDQ